MILKASLLIATVFVQANQVLSQEGQPQQQYNPQQYTPQQQYNPQQYNPYGSQSWDPYMASASNVWMDYIKKAAEVSQQLYKQWDKTGASNLIAAGMGYAHQWAKEAQKAAEAAMKVQGGAIGALH